MAAYDNPFDRLGNKIKMIAEEAIDRFRASYTPDVARLFRELRSLGLTPIEADRHVRLVISTTI